MFSVTPDSNLHLLIVETDKSRELPYFEFKYYNYFGEDFEKSLNIFKNP
jgi:hypothetical protein